MKVMNTTRNEKLKEEVTQMLRRHPGVPADFEAIFVIKADAGSVENARATLHFEKGATGTVVCIGLLALPLLLPIMMCGLGCAIHKSREALKELVKDAEENVYVYGLRGFATVSNGKVKKWTPAEGMTLVPELQMFHQSVSGPCGSSVKSQAVLLVRTNKITSVSESSGCCESPLMADLRSGRCQQVWFVSEKSMLTLPATVMASQFGVQQSRETDLNNAFIEECSGYDSGAMNAGIPASNPAVTSLGTQQREQQMLATIMQQQVMMNRTTASPQKAAKAGVAFRNKAGA